MHSGVRHSVMCRETKPACITVAQAWMSHWVHGAGEAKLPRQQLHPPSVQTPSPSSFPAAMLALAGRNGGTGLGEGKGMSSWDAILQDGSHHCVPLRIRCV
jgi:hypothetical protein